MYFIAQPFGWDLNCGIFCGYKGMVALVGIDRMDPDGSVIAYLVLRECQLQKHTQHAHSVNGEE